jgi:serine protease Do
VTTGIEAVRGLALAACLVPLAAAASPQRRTPVVVAVERVKGSVVNISTEELVQRRVGENGNDLFSDFYRNFFEAPKVERSYVATALGSGAIIDPAGFVVTNFHVIARGARIKVGLVDGREFVARVVGTDPDSDLAVLAIQSPSPLPAAPLGTSSDLMIGETTIAIGDPFGFSHTVTTGVVSALHRSVKAQGHSYYDFIQTDAAINPGNSGGPLANIDGDVIGINTAIYGDAQGIGFAIPIDRVRHIAHELLSHGEVREAWTGLVVQDSEGGKGAVISDVEPGSPAAKLQVSAGWVIVAVNDLPVQDADEYRYRMRGIEPGNTIRVTVSANGQQQTVQLATAEFSMRIIDDIIAKRIGLQLAESSASKQSVLVVRSVARGSAAWKVGIRPGDAIRAVNAIQTDTIQEFRQAVRRARANGVASLWVQRGYLTEEVQFAL